MTDGIEIHTEEMPHNLLQLDLPVKRPESQVPVIELILK